jgi:hypothetical protein
LPTPKLGTVQISSREPGWTVYLNGEPVGETPLTLELIAGAYAIELRDHDKLMHQQTLILSEGDELVIAAAGPDTSPPVVTLLSLPNSLVAGQPLQILAQAQDDEQVRWIRLLVNQRIVAELNGPRLEYQWDTAQADPGTYQIEVQAEDVAGNQGSAATEVDIHPPPTAVPSATPTAGPPPTSPAPAITDSDLHVGETELTILSYPYEPFLYEKVDPYYGMSFWALDRPAYEASQPQTVPRTFKAIILENRFLRLTFIPELGGRLYQCTLKASGQDLFYNNRVLKPSYWGPLSRDENWWLAAGGMEWALPVHEHGYASGRPWSYDVDLQKTQAIITLRDQSGQEQLQTEITVILPSESSHFIVRPRLINQTAQPMSLQFWINAMLTLGTPSASSGIEFLYPTTRMIVHSTGDASLPGERQELAWPVFGDRDLSQYRNWSHWLGVFVADVQKEFVGAYNHETGLGIARVFPKSVAHGIKLFAFGAQFPGLNEFADDQSDYFEMWGGPCRTFWPEDNITLSPGQELEWREVWLPITGIGGLDEATAEVAVNTTVQRGQVRLGITSARARLLQVTLLWNGVAIHEQTLALTAGAPLLLTVPLPSTVAPPATLTTRVRDPQGTTLLEYVEAIAP